MNEDETPRMKEHLPAALIALSILLLSACSTIDRPAGPTTTVGQQVPTSTTSVAGVQLAVEPVSQPELDANLTGDDLLVAIEARWMCDVQRYAYSDLSAMNEALFERLSASGLSQTDYDRFKATLEDRVDLREQVLVQYEVYCTDD
ncbi:MAG: hypothetical protein ACXW1Y_02270 [Acidimicrobiia bacterium]